MKFAIRTGVVWLALVAVVQAAQPPVVRDPGVIYLSDFDLKPVRLTVREPAPTSFDLDGRRYAGTLRAAQDVELQAVGERLFRVRGRAQQGQILAWVDPEYLEGLPDGFLAALRASEERRQMVEALIAKGEVAIGMTPEEVERSIGRPNKRSSRTDAEKTEHTWEYVKYATIPQQTTVIGRDGVATIGTTYVRTPVGTLTVEFTDGLVRQMSESEGSILRGLQTTVVAPPVFVY